MKKLLFVVSLSIFSCAQLTPDQQDAQWKEVFIGHTACTEKDISIQRVQSLNNIFGNEVRRSYAFNCGQEKYACSLQYNDAQYRWNYSCMNKISHGIAGK
jgi:hypothetical protein